MNTGFPKSCVRGPCQTTCRSTAAAPEGDGAHSGRIGATPQDQPSDAEPFGKRPPEHDPQNARPALPRPQVSARRPVRARPTETSWFAALEMPCAGREHEGTAMASVSL